jgi:multisubunit Na+/H+ antiporter MnhE subunit
MEAQPREAQEREAQARPERSVRIWLAWWVALALVWLLLVDTLEVDELVVGAAAAAIAATVATAVHRRGYIRFRPKAAWLLETPHLIVGVVVDCGLLAHALWRRVVRREPIEGVTLRVPFHHGGDTGHDGARRALVNFAVSLTPNSYVVDIDPEGDSLLVHNLIPVPLDRVLRREQRRAEVAFDDPTQGEDR